MSVVFSSYLNTFVYKTLMTHGTQKKKRMLCSEQNEWKYTSTMLFFQRSRIIKS